MNTCGWCIIVLRRTFIISTVEVASLIPVQKEQNLFKSKEASKSRNVINLLKRYNEWQWSNTL